MLRDAVHVFLNGARGVPVVRALSAAGYGVAGLIVPPDRCDSIAAALGGGAPPLHAVADVNAPEFVERIAAARPSLFVIAGFSTIFRPALLAVPRYGAINLHAGRLPQYRGGSPLNWQMIAGEAEAGLSVIRVDAGIDSGDVLAEATVPIGPRTTIGDLHDAANALFPDLVLRAMERVADAGAGRRQDPAEAAYWHQRGDGDGRLRWDRLTAAEADRFIRAITRPYPGAFSFADGRELRIFAAEPSDLCLRGVAGRVCRIQGDGPYVICADRALRLTDYRFPDAPERRLRHGDYLE